MSKILSITGALFPFIPKLELLQAGSLQLVIPFFIPLFLCLIPQYQTVVISPILSAIFSLCDCHSPES